MKLKKYIKCLKLFLIIFIIFLSNGTAFARESEFGTTEKSILAHIHKNQNEYKIDKIEVISGKSDYNYSYEVYKGIDYDGSVVSFSGKKLGYYPANQMFLMLCFDNFDPEAKIAGKCQELEEGDIELRIPYFTNGKYAEIYNPKGEKILTIDLSSKATCNENNICDKPIEDSNNCLSDCGAEEESATPSSEYSSNQKFIIDQNQLMQKKKGISAVLIILLVLVLLVLVIGVVIFLIKKKREEDED